MRLLAAALLLAGPNLSALADAPVSLVVCAPGYPGTTEEAQPSMDTLAAQLARSAGLPPGAVAAVYLNGEEEGVARLRAPGATVAMVPLPFYAKYAKTLALRPRLTVVRQGAQGPLETWTLVAKKGRVGSPAALSGFILASSAGYSPAFVRGALAGWGPLPPDVKVVASNQVLSSLRRAAAGEGVAVLLDPEQAAALPGLPFASDLEVVARSPPMPGAFVTTVGAGFAEARWKVLEKGLLTLNSEPQGTEVLGAVRLESFAPLSPEALSLANHLVTP
ncbi:MAG TPA: hypothetical protein VFG59_11375 [Anaeromyxobacter sp.]|nr:hypothetical protein [Anaeromyxobacter sp.]